MTVLDQWFGEVWNKGNLSAVDELLAPDVIIHNTLDGTGEKVLELPVFKQMFSTLRSDLSEVVVTADVQLRDGDLEAAHCTISAVYIGEPERLIPQRQIRFNGTSLVRVANGKIVESWNHFDFESMYRQME